VDLHGVEGQGSRLSGIAVEHAGERLQIRFQVLVDGSDRGDLWPLCGAGFRQGWEPQEQWQEPSAPSQARLDQEGFFRQQPLQSPTWVVMGQLPPGAAPGSMPTPADGATSSLPAPFSGASQAFGLERTITYGRLPGGLVMLNWPLQGNDWHGHGLELLEPAATTGPIAAAMRAHSKAFASALEEASGGWLTPAACFPAAGGAALSGPSSLALMPYWREGRRLRGRTVLVEQQLLPLGTGESQGPLPWDGDGALEAVAVGNYANDHHYPGADWPLAPKSIRWGGRWSGTPFTVPYRALLSADYENLLAADKNFSVSHMANGATRLQPLILNIGQAAGAAAALAVEQGIPPAALPVRQLQERLIGDPWAPAAVLPLWDTPWHASDWASRQLQLLEQPECLQADGRIEARFLRGPDPWAGAAEPGETPWSGRVQPDGEGGFQFLAAGAGPVPLITLEPGLNRWLQDLDGPVNVTLVGCLNPWGPWLRASRLSTD
jgi:hypothetical protein